MLFADGPQALEEPVVDFIIVEAQHMGVPRVSRHALHSEEQRGAQRNQIGIAAEQRIGVQVLGAAQGFLLGAHLIGQRVDSLRVKIRVGQRGKQAVHGKHSQMLRRVFVGGAGQPHQRAHQDILSIGHIGLFAADAAHGAAFAAGGLFALITKHVGHSFSSCSNVSLSINSMAQRVGIHGNIFFKNGT